MTCTVPPPLYSLPPIQKRVGDGTYGYVNLVRSKKTQERFAIKVMKKKYVNLQPPPLPPPLFI